MVKLLHFTMVVKHQTLLIFTMGRFNLSGQSSNLLNNCWVYVQELKIVFALELRNWPWKHVNCWEINIMWMIWVILQAKLTSKTWFCHWIVKNFHNSARDSNFYKYAYDLYHFIVDKFSCFCNSELSTHIYGCQLIQSSSK